MVSAKRIFKKSLNLDKSVLLLSCGKLSPNIGYAIYSSSKVYLNCLYLVILKYENKKISMLDKIRYSLNDEEEAFKDLLKIKKEKIYVTAEEQ